MLGLGGDEPRQLGPYRLRAVVGGGGMGQVYLGTSPAGRAVAVKVIGSGLAAEPGYRQRFAREARAAMAVSGLYTASVVDADTEGEHPYIATEFVAAPSLAESVKSAGPLPTASVFALAAGLAEALAAIHRAGLVHRDVKPHNILLAADGPVVIDFGIALGDGTALTATGTTIGTAGYIAPEVLGGHDPTSASDVFSLGCVLVYAARGVGPYGTGDPLSLTHRTVSQPPDLTGTPEAVSTLVKPLLERDPTLRPTPAQLVRQVALTSGTAVLRDAMWLPEEIRVLLERRRAEVQQVLSDHGGRILAPAGATEHLAAPPAQAPADPHANPGPQQPLYSVQPIQSTQPPPTQLPPTHLPPTYAPPVPAAARDKRRGGLFAAAGAGGTLLVVGAVATAILLTRHDSTPPGPQNTSTSSHSAPGTNSGAAAADAQSTRSYKPGSYAENKRLAVDLLGNTATLQSVIVNGDGTVEAKISYTAAVPGEWTCALAVPGEATLTTANGTADASTASDCTRDPAKTWTMTVGQSMVATQYFAHAPDGDGPWTLTLAQREFTGSVSGISIPTK